MADPIVSVITPTYNSAWCIQATLESALSQTMSDLEVVVVDDGSTDDTAELVHAMGDPRVRFVQRQEQGGVSAARNTGIEAARGKYIALLDHDDFWSRDKLERQIPLFEQDPEVGLVFSDCTLFMEGSREAQKPFFSRRPPRGWIFRELLRRDFILCPTAVMRRTCLDEVGLFNEELHYSEEYDLFLRLAYRYRADYVDAPLAEYRQHPPDHPSTLDDSGIREDRLVLKGFADTVQDFSTEYRDEIKVANRRILRREALVRWRQGKRLHALRLLMELLRGGPDRLGLLLLPALLLNYKTFAKLQAYAPTRLVSRAMRR